jgi:hypothetical protein
MIGHGFCPAEISPPGSTVLAVTKPGAQRWFALTTGTDDSVNSTASAGNEAEFYFAWGRFRDFL